MMDDNRLGRVFAGTRRKTIGSAIFASLTRGSPPGRAGRSEFDPWPPGSVPWMPMLPGFRPVASALAVSRTAGRDDDDHPPAGSTELDVLEHDREQAHLPAEQPPPGEDARLPAAHAHPCRTGDHRCSSPQGTRRAVGLTARLVAPRSFSSPVLPLAHRMRHSSDFSSTVRVGRRARRGCLVVHHLADARAGSPESPALVGFVVSRAVGGSVERHRVTRRLRHVARSQLAELEPGSATVIRALDSAVTATSADLAADFNAALRAAQEPRIPASR
jgi:ribonuclease P protein component